MKQTLLIILAALGCSIASCFAEAEFAKDLPKVLNQFKTEVIISPELEKEYQDAALRVMKKHGVQVNDLYALIKPQQDKVQGADNVHFSGAGYGMLAKQVADTIAASLGLEQAAPK